MGLFCFLLQPENQKTKNQTELLTFDFASLYTGIEVNKMRKFNIEEFVSIYKTKINESDLIFQRFLKFIEKKENLEKLFFFNDEYEIPPADLFTRMNKDLFDLVKKEFISNKGEKQKLGAYFGYLFQFMYGDYYQKGKKIQIRYNETNMYVLSSASAFCRKQGE